MPRLAQLAAACVIAAVASAVYPHGQNDGAGELLAVTRAQFDAYLERHHALNPVGEPTDTILGSYLKLDPLGRAVGDGTGRHVYSELVLEIGLAAAAAQVGWNPARFEGRGGSWEW